MSDIRIRPQDYGLADVIVADYGEYAVVFDGEAYFGFYWPSEVEFSEMCEFEEAEKWCLDSIAQGYPISRDGPA